MLASEHLPQITATQKHETYPQITQPSRNQNHVVLRIGFATCCEAWLCRAVHVEKIAARGLAAGRTYYGHRYGGAEPRLTTGGEPIRNGVKT
jgi:hypothetical protein